MKITGKTLMVAFEHELKIGANDSIELTLLSNAYISEGKNGNVEVDVDLGIDFIDVKFLGNEVDNSFSAFNGWKESLKNIGIDFNELVEEQEQKLIDSGIEDKLKLMFRDKI
jgi:recombination DNA repair RAD52 pathway protein